MIYGHKLARQAGEPVVRDPYAGRLVTKTDVAGTSALMTIAFDGKPLAAIMAQVFQQGRPLPTVVQHEQFAVQTKPGDEALMLVAIGCLRKPPAPSVEELNQVLFDCPDWQRLAEEHRHWWSEFWSRSGVHLSHPGMDRLWHLGTYFLGANARPDSPPISLQGVWSEDGMVPWGNRLGWDLNVQATYSPIYTGNHLDLGFSLYDWYRKYLPRMVDFAKSIFGPESEGAFLFPGTDDLGQTWVNESSGGLGAGAWVGHHFWQHYLYSGDLISGVIEKGKLVSATVTSERAGACRLAVDDQISQWRGTTQCGVVQEAGQTVIHTLLRPGETIRVSRVSRGSA